MYDVDGTESPQELETLFHAMKFLMSFSFTSAEELREVAEREAVQMAEKEEAWEEQKIALKVMWMIKRKAQQEFAEMHFRKSWTPSEIELLYQQMPATRARRFVLKLTR
ncbi:unnamed protein product [Nippostrongylus brasiliensis]|uniref:MAGE domain-containing protein n=1 Tax=Nippostrongylus brasiliensis TaxID=27835 RepID=A0A0N4YJ75_NIPBR|nr:unnamed protein product [Nippostrongylus brasiliensis]